MLIELADFAELLLRSYELLKHNEAIRTHYQERFRHILLYTLILIAATLLPYIYGMSGLVYLIAAVLLGFIFLTYVIALFTLLSLVLTVEAVLGVYNFWVGAEARRVYLW